MQTDELRLTYETLLGVRAKCYVCGTCSASTYGLTPERAFEATAGSISSCSEACIVLTITWLMQALEKIKHDVLMKSKLLTCTARMHWYWPLPELRRPLRFFKDNPIASVDDMHRPRRGRPLLAASVARGDGAIAEVGAAGTFKKSSREAAATAAGCNLQ